jgi:hypothetical protein
MVKSILEEINYSRWTYLIFQGGRTFMVLLFSSVYRKIYVSLQNLFIPERIFMLLNSKNLMFVSNCSDIKRCAAFCFCLVYLVHDCLKVSSEKRKLICITALRFLFSGKRYSLNDCAHSFPLGLKVNNYLSCITAINC